MVRKVACALVALFLFAGLGMAADKAQKNQMVRGTIKSVDLKAKVLVVNQKVGDKFVDRELNITENVEFVIKNGNDTKEASGSEGLSLLEGKENSSVQVKCDKDVNVLKVTVMVKK